MKKNNYTIFVFIGALLLFSILPMLNYSIDKHRVFHHDYNNTYTDVSINTPYLRVSYLLNNKDKYDTIVFGSSRNAALDMGKISTRAYSLAYRFGVTGSHLKNLKTLLENGVSIKNVWIGINDYIIWKNPDDHEIDHGRKTYKSTFLGKLDFYSFYLFNKPDYKDWNILTGKDHLTPSNRVLQKNISSIIKDIRLREKEKKTKSAAWIKKMTIRGAMTLGYQDGKSKYRIDEAVDELKQIKTLCDAHNVKLKIFMFPTFYKTYLQYNQYKIENFKRKLATSIDFYDFYDLSDIALNELNWRDSSHFTVSIGDFIIESIQNNNFLVTSDNIDTHVLKIRKMMHSIPSKYVPIKYIQRFNPNIDISMLKPIFKLNNTSFKCDKNTRFSKEEYKYYTGEKIYDGNPEIVLNDTKANLENVILTYRVESQTKTIFQVFYKKSVTSKYNEKDSYRVTLRKGMNKINLLIPSEYINNILRIDPVNSPGEYSIKELAIYGL